MGTTPPPAVTAGSLNQAAYVSGTSTYRFGHRSILNMVIADAPVDADYTRWAMLHDGAVYRLYLFKQNTNDTLYQFGFNARTGQYEYGYQSIPELKLTNIPDDADTSRFAMLHDGSVYRLYLGKTGNEDAMYQFGYNPSSSDYEFGYSSIPQLTVADTPDGSIKDDEFTVKMRIFSLSKCHSSLTLFFLLFSP